MTIKTVTLLQTNYIHIDAFFFTLYSSKNLGEKTKVLLKVKTNIENIHRYTTVINIGNNKIHVLSTISAYIMTCKTADIMAYENLDLSSRE